MRVLFVILLIFLCTSPNRANAMWCAWSDWSAHSPDKCGQDRATCEKAKKKSKTKADCAHWFN